MKRMLHRSLTSLIVGASTFIVAACSSSSSSPVDPTASLVTRFTEAATLLTSATGLKDAKIPALFDDTYKEAGYTKANLSVDLQAEAAALAANPDASLFPIATLKNVTVSACDASSICTLTGTLVNSDVDTTETVVTTKVKKVNDEYYFIGDQQAS
jgi:hypothetical protein